MSTAEEDIRVAVVGSGYFGAGLVRRLSLLPGYRVVIVANRTVARAVRALRNAGFSQDAIAVCQQPEQALAEIQRGRVVVTTELLLPAMLEPVDVVVEATGDVLVGTTVALACLGGRKHLVAANPETQATVGPILNVLAGEAGVVYSDVDGDEPGILKNLYDYCRGMGLDVVVAGNCKGMLKRYATPRTEAAFADRHGLKPWITTAAADGTKLAFESTVVANATGLRPKVRGMNGPTTSLPTLVEDLATLGLLNGGRYIEYTLGIGRGVFAVVHSEDPETRRDFRYLKMGDGPYYVFHRQQVLVHYEAHRSVARAARRGLATVAPLGVPVAETVAVAKQDLEAGVKLDGIGGFHCYGLIVDAETARRDALLPMGLSPYGRLARALRKDEPLTYQDVELDEDNLAVKLRRRQDCHFSAQTTPPVSDER